MDYYKRIDKMIIKELDKGRDIAIVPFGKLGMLTKSMVFGER